MKKFRLTICSGGKKEPQILWFRTILFARIAFQVERVKAKITAYSHSASIELARECDTGAQSIKWFALNQKFRSNKDQIIYTNSVLRRLDIRVNTILKRHGSLIPTDMTANERRTVRSYDTLRFYENTIINCVVPFQYRDSFLQQREQAFQKNPRYTMKIIKDKEGTYKAIFY